MSLVKLTCINQTWKSELGEREYIEKCLKNPCWYCFLHVSVSNDNEW